jgi:hypothetical protein
MKNDEGWDETDRAPAHVIQMLSVSLHAAHLPAQLVVVDAPVRARRDGPGVDDLMRWVMKWRRVDDRERERAGGRLGKGSATRVAPRDAPPLRSPPSSCAQPGLVRLVCAARTDAFGTSVCHCHPLHLSPARPSAGLQQHRPAVGPRRQPPRPPPSSPWSVAGVCVCVEEDARGREFRCARSTVQWKALPISSHCFSSASRGVGRKPGHQGVGTAPHPPFPTPWRPPRPPPRSPCLSLPASHGDLVGRR